MEFQSNGSDTDLKLVNTSDRVLSNGTRIPAGVVAYVWKTGNGYWQATTAEDTGRQIIRDANYRRGQGYTGRDEARRAVITHLTQGEGI